MSWYYDRIELWNAKEKRHIEQDHGILYLEVGGKWKAQTLHGDAHRAEGVDHIPHTSHKAETKV